MRLGLVSVFGHCDQKLSQDLTEGGNKLNRPNIYEFFNTMPAEEFENKFLELSRTDEFSAVASSAGKDEDMKKVKIALIAAGVQKNWVEKDEMFHAIINHITYRILNKTT